MGMEVERHVRISSIRDLEDTQGVLFIGLLPDRYSDSEIERISNWVRNGGHLVINAYTRSHYYYEDNVSTSNLLEKLDISIKYIKYGDRGERKNWLLNIDSKPYMIDPGYQSIELVASDSIKLLNNKMNSHSFVQFKYDEGLVSVFRDTHFFLNNSLIDYDHALFANDLFGLNNFADKLWIVMQPRMPHFTELIWDYYRKVVISCMLLLIVFLFWKGRRFGPIKTMEVASRRSLLEQIHAAGLFAVKTRSLDMSIERVRKDLQRKIERKHPTILFEIGGDIFGEISKITGMDRSEIKYAFTFSVNNQQIEFLNIIKLLQKIGKRI